jgi:hypothetical protein
LAFFLAFIFLLFPAFDKAMAIAWGWAYPSPISVLMFLLTTFVDLPFLSGMEVKKHETDQNATAISDEGDEARPVAVDPCPAERPARRAGCSVGEPRRFDISGQSGIKLPIGLPTEGPE